MEETNNLLKPILNTIQITSAVILIGIILMQVRGQGGGLVVLRMGLLEQEEVLKEHYFKLL